MRTQVVKLFVLLAIVSSVLSCNSDIGVATTVKAKLAAD